MKLLRYFIENEGVVVSRSQLLTRVGHVQQSYDQNRRQFHRPPLRKYFEADPAEPRYFLSVRGAGYRFVANAES